jgi:hypothetical protein
MARVTAALLNNNSSSRHRTFLNPLAAREAVVAAAKEAVAAAPNGDSSNSAMAISVTPVSGATTVITADAAAISGDVADNVRRTDRAVVAEEVVVVAEEGKSRRLAHQSLR